MNNSEKHRFSDFTHAHYQELLNLAAENDNGQIFNDQLLKLDSFTLWRHDIDMSVEAALNLAKMEAKKGIKATYFIHLHSTFYNFFERELVQSVKKIHQLGHSLGLHFDCTFYESNKDIEAHLHFEKSILETTYGVPIEVFSFHNPTADILNHFQEWRYAGMINTYATFFREMVEYCSDSNGIWRFDRLSDFLKLPGKRKIQVLTHPIWWTANTGSPRDKIWAYVEKRSEFIKSDYLDVLKNGGRELIDW